MLNRLRIASQSHGLVLKMDVIPEEVIRNVKKWKHKEIQEKAVKVKTEGEAQGVDRLPLKLRSALYEFSNYLAVDIVNRLCHMIRSYYGVGGLGTLWQGPQQEIRAI